MRILATCLVLGFLAITSARADVVRMHDGRVFTGKILSTNDGYVEIDTVISGIRTTLRLDPSNVLEVEYDESTVKLPERPADHAENADASGRMRDSSDQAYIPPTRYLVVPVHGVIGEDVLAPAVKDTIDHANRRGIKHIVFDINTPGGLVGEARGISNIINGSPDQVQTHAFVRRSLSAGIWVAFSCDNIYMAPSSSIGAAVAYNQNNTTGAIEVDKKMNSLLAGHVASIAEARGIPSIITRAMVMPSVEVYAVFDESGDVRILDKKPTEDVRYSIIDTEDTVLTLTANEMERLLLAHIVQDIGRIGDVIGADKWEKHSRYGEAAVRKAAEERRRRLARIEELRTETPSLLRSIPVYIESARNIDPSRYSYDRKRSGEFTWNAKQQWKRNSKRAYQAWEDVIESCRKVVSNINEGNEIGIDLEHELGIAKNDMQTIANMAGREQARLDRNYDRD